MRASKSAFRLHFPFVQAALVLGATLLLAPNPKLSHPRVRFISKTLKISLAKKTPPRLAFEAVLSFQNEVRKPAATPGLVPQPISLNQVIAKGQLRPAERSLFYKKIELPKMIITRETVAVRPKLNLDPALGRAVSGGSVMTLPSERSETSVPNWVDTLTPRQRRLVEASGLSVAELNRVQEEPSLAQALAAKVEEELNVLREKGTPVTASTPTGVSSTQTSTLSEKSPDVQIPVGPFAVQGIIHLSDATPYLPDHRFEVHWFREGYAKKAGRVQVKDARFFIEVPELIGQVRVEMLDGNGQVVAESSQRLSADLTTSALSQLHLRMQPVSQVAARYTDFYQDPNALFAASGDSKKKISPRLAKIIRTKTTFDDEAIFESDDKGRLFIDGVTAQSTSLAITESEDFYPALHFLKAGGVGGVLPMIPKRTANALMSIVDDQLALSSGQKNASLVLGQLTVDGKPIAGVRVELEGFPDVKPIYLNEILLPDPRLTESTGSGYFVFMHLPADLYSVRAQRGGQYFGFGNVASEPASVSFINIEAAKSFAAFEVRSFDAFTGEAVATELDLQALGQRLSVEGYGVFEHPILPQLSLIESNPSSDLYIPSIHPYFADQSYAHLPLVRREWMDGLLARERISLAPGSGAILGFSEKGGYEISLPHLSENNDAKVIFFDASGHLVPAAVEQGGFLIVNLPASAQSVVLRQALGERVSQVLPVDSDRLTISRFVF